MSTENTDTSQQQESPVSDVVDRESTPDEQAALDSARAALFKMVGREVPDGRTTSTPGAAALAAREAAAPAPTRARRGGSRSRRSSWPVV